MRKLLREDRDGMTLKEMSEMLKAHPDSLYDALYKMPDAYIDRWTETNRYVTSEAIWCVVVPPPHAPRPNPSKEESYD
jgi:hypothetical protein